MAEYTNSDVKAGAAFIARMLPFLADGLTWEDAGKAVLQRDAALFDCFRGCPEAREKFASDVYRRINNT